MLTVPRIIFAIAVVVGVIVFLISYLKSWSGKPVRGVLQVPQGKTRIALDVYDGSSLKPYKFGQVFETTFDPNERTLTRAHTGETYTAAGAILFRGHPLGFADEAHPYTQVLATLAHRYPKVLVQAIITTLGKDGEPMIELIVANPNWFKRALQDDRRYRD